MKRSFMGGLAFLAILACAQPDSDTLAITNALIIDGNGGAPIEDGVLVVTGDRISAVGSATDVLIPDGARVLDVGGNTVMPGLADMHVHLVGGWDGFSTDMLGYQRYLNALLYSGVTTVLDVGNVLPFIQQMRSEIEAGRIAGPRIYMVGPLVDAPDAAWPPITYIVANYEDLRSFVVQLKAAGVDMIKGYSGLNAEQVDSLVAVAEEESLGVVVDLGPPEDHRTAVRSGVTALAHAPTGEWGDDAVAEMLENGTANITTLAVIEWGSWRRLGDLSFLDHPLVTQTTPPWFLDDLRAMGTSEVTDRDAARRSRSIERLASAQANLKRLHDAGVPLVTGTDAPYPGVFQGEGVHRELELLVEAGLSPLEAISAATKNAAALMNAGDEWGTLEVGKIADLIVVEGNPAENVADTRNIVTVIQGGDVLDRGSLTFPALNDPGFRTTGTVGSN